MPDVKDHVVSSHANAGPPNLTCPAAEPLIRVNTKQRCGTVVLTRLSIAQRPLSWKRTGPSPAFAGALRGRRALDDHKVRCVQLADRGVDEIDRPRVRRTAQGQHGPTMPIVFERVHNFGNGVVIAHAVREIDDAERVISKSGNRIDLVAGIDRDGQARAVIVDIDMGRAIDDRLVAEADDVELI